MTRETQDAPTSGDRPRLTPYELVFGAEAFERERFPAILDEAEGREVGTADPARFLMLGTVAQLIEQILPEEAPGAAVEPYGRLLFHAFQFWRFDRFLVVLQKALARRLVEAPRPIGEWEMLPPHPAGYLQLPRHLFWSRVEPNATPEPVDGIFWSMVGRDDPTEPPYARLDALLVLGMRPDRPGLSVVPVSEAADGELRGHWGDADARPDGHDFANILPGGELDELHALVTPGEVLKLLSRAFHHAAVRPGALGEPEAGGESAAPGADEAGAGSAGVRGTTEHGGAAADGTAGAGAGRASEHALPPSRLAFRPLTEVERDG